MLNIHPSFDDTTYDVIEQTVDQRLWGIALGMATSGHDLKSLLAAVYGNLQLVIQDSPASPSLEMMLSMQSLERAIALLHRILRNIPEGKQNSVCDVAAVVAETLVLGRALWAQVPDLAVTTEMPASALAAIADHDLRRITLNLFMNATAAMPSGGRLHVEIRSDKTWVTVAIRDSGHGMDTALAPDLARPFATHRVSGVGLGLTSCHVLLQKAGGHMEIESARGLGTTVTLRLPRDHQESIV